MIKQIDYIIAGFREVSPWGFQDLSNNVMCVKVSSIFHSIYTFANISLLCDDQEVI